MNKEAFSLLDKIINDVVGLLGLASFGYGAWQLMPEAAYISVGIILMFAAYRMAKGV